MGDEAVLLLFDEEHPCWDEETVRLAGEDSEGLKRLERSGLLEKRENIYILTEMGRKAYIDLCKGQFVEANPGMAPEKPSDQRRSLWRTRLQVLLDKSFIARWGLKEFHPGIALEYVPGLKGEEIVSLKGCDLKWTYLSNPEVQRIKTHFSVTGLKARELKPHSLDEIRMWLEENNISRECFTVDLLFLSRYDFAYYVQFPKHPNDRLGLVNADRFFFFKACPPFKDNLRNFVETIGQVHLYLMNQRHMYLPGYFDLDLADQDSLSWITWITETEEEALSLAGCFKPFGQSLIEPAKPMDIWIISTEKLKEIREKQETLFDLFSMIAHPVARTV